MPDVSAIVIPTGNAYRLMREIIGALDQEGGPMACPDLEPHVTIQYVHDASDVDAVVDCFRQICRSTEPFDMRFGEINSFDSVLGVHVALEPSAELLALYLRTQSALRDMGERPYEYTAEDWRPHLTLSSHQWSRDLVQRIAAMYGRLDVSFLATRVRISRLDGSGQQARWVAIADVPIGPVTEADGHEPSIGSEAQAGTATSAPTSCSTSIGER